ncbi:hypothetical protein MTO96_040755 [Rhipicephalus appendiculatus]
MDRRALGKRGARGPPNSLNSPTATQPTSHNWTAGTSRPSLQQVPLYLAQTTRPLSAAGATFSRPTKSTTARRPGQAPAIRRHRVGAPRAHPRTVYGAARLRAEAPLTQTADGRQSEREDRAGEEPAD